MRAGKTLRAALAESVHPGLAPAARRIRLGLPMSDALEGSSDLFGGDAPALRLVSELHARTGGDPAAMLEAVARSIEARVEGAGRAEAGAAGARLSARLIAWLPVAALLLLPGSRAPLLDAPGLAALAGGIGLCLGGMRWMDRLLPAPSEEADLAGLLAVVAATALRSGCSLDQVLDIAAGIPEAGLLRGPGRLHRLGLSWPTALTCSTDPGLRALGEVLDALHRNGVPAAGALDAFAERRRHELELDLDRAIRRAPVKMVIPLTLCVLPAFGLIALTPFLRSLAPT